MILVGENTVYWLMDANKANWDRQVIDSLTYPLLPYLSKFQKSGDCKVN